LRRGRQGGGDAEAGGETGLTNRSHCVSPVERYRRL
jgi:hypothetical protein